jgi:hypothetical protein
MVSGSAAFGAARREVPRPARPWPCPAARGGRASVRPSMSLGCNRRGRHEACDSARHAEDTGSASLAPRACRRRGHARYRLHSSRISVRGGGLLTQPAVPRLGGYGAHSMTANVRRDECLNISPPITNAAANPHEGATAPVRPFAIKRAKTAAEQSSRLRRRKKVRRIIHVGLAVGTRRNLASRGRVRRANPMSLTISSAFNALVWS